MDVKAWYSKFSLFWRTLGGLSGIMYWRSGDAVNLGFEELHWRGESQVRGKRFDFETEGSKCPVLRIRRAIGCLISIHQMGATAFVRK